MLKYDIILDICNTHSLSATAEKYSYSQPAVSQIVKNFEKELGMQLFTRTKGGMQLLPGTEGIISSLRKMVISGSVRSKVSLITGFRTSCRNFLKNIRILLLK